MSEAPVYKLPTTKACTMISLRDVTVTSIFGVTVFLEKNKPTLVPGRLVDEAAKMGCVPFDAEEYEAHKAAKQVQAEEAQTQEKKLIDAVRRLVERNNKDDFTGTGYPKLDALERESGMSVTAVDRDAAFAAWRRENLGSTPQQA